MYFCKKTFTKPGNKSSSGLVSRARARARTRIKQIKNPISIKQESNNKNQTNQCAPESD